MTPGDGTGRDVSLSERSAIDPPEWFVEQANVCDADVYDAFDAEWPDCWDRAGALLDWETLRRGVPGR